jgi:hypothetical protein
VQSCQWLASVKRSVLIRPRDGNRFGRKIDLQPVIPQHSRSYQDLIAGDNGRLRSNHSAIEWEIDEVEIFLDSLICGQKGCRTANETRVETTPYSSPDGSYIPGTGMSFRRR